MTVTQEELQDLRNDVESVLYAEDDAPWSELQRVTDALETAQAELLDAAICVQRVDRGQLAHAEQDTWEELLQYAAEQRQVDLMDDLWTLFDIIRVWSDDWSVTYVVVDR